MMRIFRWWLAWVLVGTGLAAAADNLVLTAAIERPIDGLAARHVERALQQAAIEHASLLVLRLDTPGGTIEDARRIVRMLLESSVPVIAWTGPAAAQTRGAGVLAAAAAHRYYLSAAARVGAAGFSQSSLNQDAAAFLRSIAEARDRPAPALEQMVSQGRLYTPEEAVAAGIADGVAQDLGALLRVVDGSPVTAASRAYTIDTDRVRVREVAVPFSDKVLGVLAEPNVAFLLLVVGGVLVVLELLSPGFVGPGAAGLLFLALALAGMGYLPVNWVGVILLIVALAMFYLEIHTPGFGIWGLTALACVAAGGWFLFEGFGGSALGHFRLSPWILGSVVVFFGLILMLFFYFMRTSGATTGYASGKEQALVGEGGIADSDLVPVGEVWVGNQRYTATTSLGEPILAGESIRVIGVYGDVLKVEKAGGSERWSIS